MAQANDKDRSELVRRARGGRRTRRTLFSEKYPSKWHPTSLVHPVQGDPFTIDNCWEWIADAIDAGAPVEVITLRQPPGKRGFTMVLEGHQGEKVYVKLQLLDDLVLGRSFHISNSNDDEE